MSDTRIESIDELEAIYNTPSEASIVKESAIITDEYSRLIEASPFVALASSGAEGLDCSPRGDQGSVVHIHDEKTLMIPDRRGNNRVDTLRNIIEDPRVALLFLIPGSGTTLRINGRAHLSIEPGLLKSFEEQGKPPRSVMVIEIDTMYFQCARAIIRSKLWDIDTMYFQCARAIIRSKLWDADSHVDKADIPSAGKILAAQTKARADGGIDGETYDAEWPGRAAKSLW